MGPPSLLPPVHIDFDPVSDGLDIELWVGSEQGVILAYDRIPALAEDIEARVLPLDRGQLEGLVGQERVLLDPFYHLGVSQVRGDIGACCVGLTARLILRHREHAAERLKIWMGRGDTPIHVCASGIWEAKPPRTSFAEAGNLARSERRVWRFTVEFLAHWPRAVHSRCGGASMERS